MEKPSLLPSVIEQPPSLLLYFFLSDIFQSPRFVDSESLRNKNFSYIARYYTQRPVTGWSTT